MTINQLIKQLEQYKKDYGGDTPVVLSADTEGNAYSTLEGSDGENNRSICPIMNDNDKVIGVCLWPWVEGFDQPEDACYASKPRKEEVK